MKQLTKFSELPASFKEAYLELQSKGVTRPWMLDLEEDYGNTKEISGRDRGHETETIKSRNTVERVSDEEVQVQQETEGRPSVQSKAAPNRNRSCQHSLIHYGGETNAIR